MPVAAAARTITSLDELTLRRAQRGDERAWRDLVALYQQPIQALVWRLLIGRSRHRVEDLVQETFVRVLRALPGFDLDGPATLSTWMLTIATRLALNELRRDEPVALDIEPIAPGRTDAELDRRRLGAAIAAGVASLGEGQRAVFVLREYHDLDYQQIAEILEIDLGTVKSRLARARAALRDHLDVALGGRHA